MGLIIYKSSAGSGKTFTLVNIFLAKVLERPWLFRRILAITFTNKATEELKARIIRELDTLASGGKSAYLGPLTTALPTLDESTIRKNAGEVLKRILHDYSSFHISTIDSFFQSLSRVLAREMMLPMKYDIELDTEAICRDVTELLLDEAGKNKAVTEWLEELLFDRMENGKNWNITTELRRMTRQLLTSDEARNWSAQADTAVLLNFIQWMLSTKKETEQTMCDFGKSAEAVLSEHQLTVDEFHYKKSGPAGYLQKIARRKSDDEVFNAINSYVERALSDPLNFLSKEKQKDAHLADLCKQHLHPLLVKATNYYKENRKKYLTICEALKLIYQSGIMHELEEKLRQYREKHQLFHLSDTTRILSKAIREQDAPFIYEKSGNTFVHMLIDEFQDTSEEQWNILKPLVLNTLGSGNDVCIVGDAKQSIYRWRGGDMELIVSGVKKDLAHTGFKPQDKVLDTNWRSSREIITFNNAFFPLAGEQMASAFTDVGQQSFEAYHTTAVQQQIGAKGEKPGFVEFRFFATEKKNPDAAEQTDLHWKEKALHQLKTEIAQQLEMGYTYRDIVLLVRTNPHEFAIADYLRRNTSFPVISSNALLLAGNDKIQFILNCLRLLLNPDQPLLHAEVCHFIQQDQPLQSFPFYKKNYAARQDAWSRQVLLTQREHLMYLPLHFVFLYLLDAGQLSKCDPYIQKISDLIDEYTGNFGNNIAGFIKWWDEHVDTRNWSVELPEGGNAIRIITIHKSKGLEFPVVFMPFLDWSLVPRPDSIFWASADHPLFKPFGKLAVYPVKALDHSWFNSDYRRELHDTALDNLNLLYVAFTRPETKLFVYGPQKTKEQDAARLLQDIILNHERFKAGRKGDFLYQSGENLPASVKQSAPATGTIYQPAYYIPADIPAHKDQLFLPALRIAYKSQEIIIGNLVHEALEIIQHRSGIKAAIERVLRRENNRPYVSLKDEITVKVSELWELLEKNNWTSDYFEVLSETEICDENQQIHRPDKVLTNDRQTIVIDFKTGKQAPEHRQQVRDYCRLLELTGQHNVSGFLIYTSEKEAVKVDWPIAEGAGQTRLFN